DAAGCSTITDFNIPPATAFALSTTQINVPCSGASVGSIDLTVNSINTPFNFIWSNGSVTEDLSNLAAGTYTVTVTDNTGCTGTTSVTITQLSNPAVALTPTNVACNGGSTGSISSLVNGGTAPYLYNWSNGANTSNINSLPIGNYTVTVTDANGCTATASVTLTQPNPNVITLEHEDITCGSDNGEVQIDNITGGGGPFTYLWSTGGTQNQIDNLTPGTYSVTVTNAAGCTSTASVTLVSISFPVLSETHVNTTCGNTNGSINISVLGGIAPFSYLWSNGDLTQDLNAVGAGTYTVTITDANGCTDNLTVTLTNSVGPTLSFSTTNPPCFGTPMGSIDLTVNGGTAPYSYIWNSGDVTQDLTNVLSGIYIVTVTDANGCTITQGVILLDGATINLSSTQINVNCFGGGTGSIDLSVNGGTVPYFYSWSNGANTQDISNLFAGNYAVTVTDGFGCTATTNITITQPPPLAFSDVITNATCLANTGAIDITVNGGNAPYSYTWSNGAVTQDLNGINSGTYSVTILDATFCSYTWTGVVAAAIPPTLSETHFDAACGLANGSINLSVNGGLPGFTFTWSNGAVTEDISNLNAGSYTVTVTDANGCTATTNSTIINTGLPITTNQSASICQGQNYNFAWGGSTNSAGTYSHTYTTASGCDSVVNITITVNPNVTSTTNTTICQNQLPYLWNAQSYAAAGTFSVTLVSAAGCDSVATLVLTVNPNVTSTTNTTICQNQLPYLWNANSY
ncbi:MAG: hypothetical protein WCI97_10835, partial [Bacteroidota bacterium]